MNGESDSTSLHGKEQPTNLETDPLQNQHATPELDAKDSPPEKEAQPNEDVDLSEPPHPHENVFQLTVQLPHPPGQTQITVSSQEQVQDIRQSLVDTSHTFQYSCFHLEHRGKRINDFVELSEISEIAQDPVCELVEDPYTETQARLHFVRVRELIGAAGDRADSVLGIDAGLSLCDGVDLATGGRAARSETTSISKYEFNALGHISTLLAKPREQAPKTLKTISLSAWNPPPHQYRMRGHLLYLQVTTNEGEQFYITSAVSGFYVNRSSNQKFDPSPRVTYKPLSAHSLITLLGQISPSFDASFKKLQEYNGQRDPLASFQLSNSIPSAPWLVSSGSVQQHLPDITRSQETLLLAGAENAETLRDWNEEFQSTKELPKESVQERVFRERLTSKLFAEYNEAAVRGAVLVARGEVQPLNPTESLDAQIFVYNNVFFSFGADGVGTFASDGGDEAARVATAKDVYGVKTVNQLDVDGIFTAGTVVVDYLGKRIVGQSIVPGIFKQRDPSEHQIDYGGVEGKDVIATLDTFVQPFSDLSKAMRVKRHPVWDKEGKKHELEASVETKGLMGTDGRKYILDLYRLTPLDITWLERHRGSDQEGDNAYPHRMTVLRPELVDSYRIVKLKEYIGKEVEKKRAGRAQEKAAIDSEVSVNGNKTENPSTDEEETAMEKAPQENGQLTNGLNGHHEESDETKEQQDQPKQETVDVSGFTFVLNPDVFSGQQPQSDAEKEELNADEAEVRAVCKYLNTEVIPKFLHDLQEGEVGFPMDGQSLIREMHKRGINVRYLGRLTQLCAEHKSNDQRIRALEQLCKQEMISRAFKHFTNKCLKPLPPCFASDCIAHLLNCLLGTQHNPHPHMELDESLKNMYQSVDLETPLKTTPQSLKTAVQRQIELRYRYTYEGELVSPAKELQMLREISLKLGLQLEAKDYQFGKSTSPQTHTNGIKERNSSDSLSVPQVNGTHSGQDGGTKKKKKKHADHSPNRANTTSPVAESLTFQSDNILNIVPILKEASPRSILAEEALDAGRVSIQQDQKEIGQELLLESLSLHEQIYGILHPEVARVYYALSTIYYSLDEKQAAVELAKKAVIVSERTLGLDNAETVLAYLNLSLFEHATGNTKQALAYVEHALDLWKIVYGPRHPDTITTINNAAVMLQTLKQFHDSRIWFEASLDICEEMSGKQSINTATLLFQLAQALALDQDSKAAVKAMRESYNVFKAELGAENQNTKEAETWLETLTQSAVSQAKQANALLQNRKMVLRTVAKGPRMAIAGRPQPPAGSLSTNGTAEPASVARPASIDQRNLDELLKYINGESSKQTTPKKKTAANPKRRQQRAQ